MARFLVVDESAENLEAIQKSLRGHVVFCAMTDKQALHILQRQQIDLVLVAAYLEESDAFALLRSVKEQEKWRDLRVVFYCTRPSQVSRCANDIVKAAGRALGVYKYVLTESPSAVQFRQLVEQCLPESCWQSSSWAAVYELSSGLERDEHPR